MLIKDATERAAFDVRAFGGFTLVEVLVALFVLSVGLLGLAALQTTSLRYNTDSYSRTQATLLAYDIMDRMRANVSAVYDGSYDVPSDAVATAVKAAFNTCKSSSCNCDSSSCSKSDLASYDLGKWYVRQGKLLPGSGARPAWIERDASNRIKITIRWSERDLDYSQVWEMQP